jgi:hypothetical protein
MKITDHFRIAPLIYVVLSLSSLLMATLACSEPERRIDPTILAPSNLSGLVGLRH